MIRLLYLLHTPLCVLNCRRYNDLRSIRGNGLVPPLGEQVYVIVVRRGYYSRKKNPLLTLLSTACMVLVQIIVYILCLVKSYPLLYLLSLWREGLSTISLD